MDNHPAFTKDNWEFLSRISDDVYELSKTSRTTRKTARNIRTLNGFARLTAICITFCVLSNSPGLLIL